MGSGQLPRQLYDFWIGLRGYNADPELRGASGRARAAEPARVSSDSPADSGPQNEGKGDADEFELGHPRPRTLALVEQLSTVGVPAARPARQVFQGLAAYPVSGNHPLGCPGGHAL